VGRAIQAAFQPRRVGAIVAGLEVAHTHVHLVPIDNEKQLDFVFADPNPPAEQLDEAVERIRAALG